VKGGEDHRLARLLRHLGLSSAIQLILNSRKLYDNQSDPL
jgi:hypothetical protein